ncbi:MAG: hypothetical protein NZ988_00495 [Thaumarchaeota archaeon]|nr:hypothetical protein [Candidatus Calditenuaceae archaeon]MDW8186514.1 cytochrome c biogenesis protein CcdA [Nitrososphaerota archaeon]
MNVDLVTVTLVFLAGLSTALSPCGYSLLPALVIYGLSLDRRPSRIAMRVVLLLTGALLTLSALTAISLAFRETLRSLMPNLNLVAGVMCVALGALGVAPRFNLMGSEFKGPRAFAIVLAGSAYSLGAAGCAVPTFAVLFTYALALGPDGALMLVLAYTTGVATPLTTLVTASSLIGAGLIKKLGRLMKYTNHLSRIVLVGAGLYLVYLWYAG